MNTKSQNSPKSNSNSSNHMPNISTPQPESKSQSEEEPDSLNILQIEKANLLNQRKLINKHLYEVNLRQRLLRKEYESEEVNRTTHSQLRATWKDVPRPKPHHTKRNFNEEGIFRDPRKDAQRLIMANIDYKSQLDKQINEKERLKNSAKQKEKEEVSYMEQKTKLDMRKLGQRLKKERALDRPLSSLHRPSSYFKELYIKPQVIKEVSLSSSEGSMQYGGRLIEILGFEPYNERKQNFENREDEKLLEIYKMEEFNKDKKFFTYKKKLLKHEAIKRDYKKRMAVLTGLDEVKEVTSMTGNIKRLDDLEKLLIEKGRIEALSIARAQNRKKPSQFAQERVRNWGESIIDNRYRFSKANPKIFHNRLVKSSKRLTKKLKSGV